MPTLDTNKFRTRFPEFSDSAAYPDATLDSFFGVACVFIQTDGSPCIILSGDQQELALEYLTAHLMVLSKQAQANGAVSNQGGFETSATIGEISVAKLAPPAKGAWDYWLYQTPYGTGLMALLSTLAAGGLHVGGLCEMEGFRKAGGVFF